MAELDVSDVLADPMFRTTFDVKRPAAGIDAHGRTSTSAPQMFRNQSGAIVPKDPNDLTRTDDGQYAPRQITVYTRFELFGGGVVGHQPDLVVWQGNEYMVSSCIPFRFGRGFFRAQCLTNTTPDPAQ